MQVRHKAYIAHYSKSSLMKVLYRDLLDSVMSHIKVKQYFCKPQLWFHPVQLLSPWWHCSSGWAVFWSHAVYKQSQLVFLSFVNNVILCCPSQWYQSAGRCCRAFQAEHSWASLLGLYTCPDPAPHKLVGCPGGSHCPVGHISHWPFVHPFVDEGRSCCHWPALFFGGRMEPGV